MESGPPKRGPQFSAHNHLGASLKATLVVLTENELVLHRPVVLTLLQSDRQRHAWCPGADEHGNHCGHAPATIKPWMNVLIMHGIEVRKRFGQTSGCWKLLNHCHLLSELMSENPHRLIHFKNTWILVVPIRNVPETVALVVISNLRWGPSMFVCNPSQNLLITREIDDTLAHDVEPVIEKREKKVFVNESCRSAPFPNLHHQFLQIGRKPHPEVLASKEKAPFGIRNRRT